MEEIWKPIDGWPYEVSNLGRVRRTLAPLGRTKAGKIMTPGPKRGGYLGITLCRPPREQRSAMIAHLVCAAFHGPKPSKSHQAAHVNGNLRDNRAENLRWSTPNENERDKIWHRTRIKGSRHANATLNEIDVKAIRAMVETGRFTKIEIAKLFGVSDGLIGHIVHGRNWTHV